MPVPNFFLAFDVTLWFEGGLVDNPKDPGGLTKFGLSKAEYPDVDIASLTLADARLIYLRDYWSSIHLDRIRDLMVATKIFDIGVDHGTVTAVEMLQEILSVKVDGVIGPITAKACRQVSALELTDKLRQSAWARHERLIKDKPAVYGEFKNGWRRRDGWPYSGEDRFWPYLPKTGETWKLMEA